MLHGLSSRMGWARLLSVLAFAAPISFSAVPSSAGENSLAGAWIVTITDDPTLVVHDVRAGHQGRRNNQPSYFPVQK
jgi:hypothetical protein